MIGNYLAAALGDLARNKVYAAISICGLAIGIAAALLMALLVRNHLGRDHFMANYDQTYMVVSALRPPGRPPMHMGGASPIRVAQLLRERYPEVTASTRVLEQRVRLRGAAAEIKERIYWADPNVFAVLEMPAHAGALRTALSRPDGIVLSRAKARKYFGNDAVVGRTLLLDDQPMTVTAILQDLPLNATSLKADIFASGLASFSRLGQLDRDPANAMGSGVFSVEAITYLRLVPGASVDKINRESSALLRELWSQRPVALDATLQVLRIDQAQLFEPLNPGIHSRISVTAVTGLLILFLACANFVNLTTARSARRAIEVGVRKAAGASRSDIIVQFLGEAAVHVLIALCLAVALTELALPHVNAFLVAGAVFDYWRDPWLIASLLGLWMALTLLAGLYPAFVVSAFRPAQVLRGLVPVSLRPNTIRQALVTLQFACLIGLAIAAGVVHRQRIYATTEALRIDTDQILLIESACRPALKAELARIPGVRAMGCADRTLLSNSGFNYMQLPDGTDVSLRQISAGAGMLELFGLTPLAGRFFATERGDEEWGATPQGASVRLVISEAAVRRFGWKTPAEAVGKTLPSGEVIGVVADFSLDSVQEALGPTVYVPKASTFNLIGLKLAGANIPETLAAIDRVWSAAGNTDALKRYFVDEHLQKVYLAVQREAQILNAFAVIAMLLACLGLFAFSASSTEQRSKEIGVRKAMGAGSSDIFRFLLWKFSVPVCWAALLAWPVTAYLMGRWLNRFAYHVALEPGLFAAATAGALLIAILTVSVHCRRVARIKPAVSLRSE